jgi:hypothetical protein
MKQWLLRNKTIAKYWFKYLDYVIANWWELELFFDDMEHQAEDLKTRQKRYKNSSRRS